MTIGENIRAFRKKRKLTQAGLGALIEPNIAYQQIQQYEAGTRNPKIETLQKIANALEIPIENLLSGENYIPGKRSIIPEFIKRYMPDDYNVLSDGDKYFIQYPDGEQSLYVSHKDIDEVIKRSQEYLKWELDKLKRRASKC